jgi:Flp pilus assembly pilin Flp
MSPTVKKKSARIAFDETGAATAEYAIATLAAVGFAGLLVAILRSDQVKAMLLDLVQRALSFSS